MFPAFTSTRQAGSFALLLMGLLLAPWALPHSCFPQNEECYMSMRDKDGPFPFLHQQVFIDKGEIDIAFIGSSRIWAGINTRYIQEQLSKRLGRNATVITLGWPSPGFDELYFISRDLLQHRKVSMLVYYDDTARSSDGRPTDDIHWRASRWFRWNNDVGELTPLPFRAKASFYFASIMGIPRNFIRVLGVHTPEPRAVPGPSYWEYEYRAPPSIEARGALSAKLGVFHDLRTFVDFTPISSSQPSDVVSFSPGNRSKFSFTGPPTLTANRHFLKLFVQDARDRGVRLVLLNFPDLNEMRSPTINERECWPDALDANIAMIGIPPAVLFAGLNEQQVRSLYFDHSHFNRNGQDYYTKLICPLLCGIYETASEY